MVGRMVGGKVEVLRRAWYNALRSKCVYKIGFRAQRALIADKEFVWWSYKKLHWWFGRKGWSEEE